MVRRRIVETLVNVLLGVAVCLLLGTAWFKYSLSEAPSPPTGKYRSGSAAPKLGIDYSQSHLTLVYLLSTHCRYCEASVPFYNRIAQRHGKRTRVFALFRENEKEVVAFTKRTGLNLTAKPDVNFQEISISSTPTVMAIGSDGIVKRVWIGTSDAVEREITRSVKDAD